MLVPAVSVALLIAGTIVLIARYALPSMGAKRMLLPSEPDTPKPFGSNMAWIAVRSEDSAAIVEALNLTERAQVNWDAGIGAVYDSVLANGYVFVSPPVKGYTFIAGIALPLPAARGFVDKLTPLLMELGVRFKEVQYFASFPVIDFYAWARIEKGRMVRAFAIGDEGVIWDRGRLTPEERALGLKLFEVRGIRGRKGDTGEAIILHPTEQQVLRMACVWSLDPSRLGAVTGEEGAGIIARTPAAWRSERLRKAA